MNSPLRSLSLAHESAHDARTLLFLLVLVSDLAERRGNLLVSIHRGFLLQSIQSLVVLQDFSHNEYSAAKKECG